MVSLLNGLAEPSYGFFKKGSDLFGSPSQEYGHDVEKAKALLEEAGYGPGNPVKAKIMISTSGSGQMVPLPMNEFMQQSLAECGFEIDFEVVEWGTMLVALRSSPTSPQALGADALNISLPPSDVAQLARYFMTSNAAPEGSNWGHWSNEEFDAKLSAIETSTDPDLIRQATAEAHAALVDDAPWLFIVHDLNPRAMDMDVKGFTSAQSWFQDFTPVYIEK